MKYKIKLINIGRQKHSEIFICEVKNKEEAIRAAEEKCSEYLVSSDTGLLPTKKKNLWSVYTGFHTVGYVEIRK